MTTPAFFGPANLFIPEATGQVVGALRKPGAFKLLDYMQIVQSKRTGGDGWPVCLFVVLDPDEPVRVVSDAEYAFEDGDDRPEGAGMLPNFNTTEVRMFRRDYPYRVGQQTVDTATLLPVLPILRQIAMMKAMTNKTARVWSLLDNAANWGSSTADANAINGGKGKWTTASATEGSPFYLAIKRSITAAVQTINLLTNSVVQPDDLKLVVSPVLAMQMANSGEITDYVKGGPFARAQQEGKESGKNLLFGLPSTYAGVELIVEDASRVSERPNQPGTPATTNRNYIKGSTNAVLMSRKGGLDGVEGAPTFSTAQIFYYKYELSVEEWQDPKNKRYEGHILDQFKEVLAYSRSGFNITNCA